MKNFVTVSSAEQQELLESFDKILCDIDGVIWEINECQIPGSINCIKSFREIGKKVHYVSNNATKSVKKYFESLQEAELIEDESDLMTPILAIIWYLKSINFKKEVFVLGMPALKEELRNAGFKVNEFNINADIGYPYSFMNHLIPDENVGAVLLDCDLHLSFLKLQKALFTLKYPDVLFLAGAQDKVIRAPMGLVIGPAYMQQPLEDLSGRKPIILAKPGALYNDFIIKKFNITDPSKVLVIGDSIGEDMKLASTSAYKKLLVLTGITTLTDIETWNWPENLKPDYYINSLQGLDGIIEKLK